MRTSASPPSPRALVPSAGSAASPCLILLRGFLFLPSKKPSWAWVCRSLGVGLGSAAGRPGRSLVGVGPVSAGGGWPVRGVPPGSARAGPVCAVGLRAGVVGGYVIILSSFCQGLRGCLCYAWGVPLVVLVAFLGVSRGSGRVLRFSLSPVFLRWPRLFGGPGRSLCWPPGRCWLRGRRGSLCSFCGSWGSGLPGLCLRRWWWSPSGGLRSPLRRPRSRCGGVRFRCRVRGVRLLWLPSLRLAFRFPLAVLLRRRVRLLGFACVRCRARRSCGGFRLFSGRWGLASSLVGWLLGSCLRFRSLGWWLALVSSGFVRRARGSFLGGSFSCSGPAWVARGSSPAHARA